MSESSNEIEQSLLELNELYSEADNLINKINDHMAFTEVQHKIAIIQNHLKLIRAQEANAEQHNNEQFFMHHLQTVQTINEHMSIVENHILGLMDAEIESEADIEELTEIRLAKKLRDDILDLIDDLREKEEAMKLQAPAFFPGRR